MAQNKSKEYMFNATLLSTKFIQREIYPPPSLQDVIIGMGDWFEKANRKFHAPYVKGKRQYHLR